MRFIGIDLAGSPKNDTGFCVLEVTGEDKVLAVTLLHSDTEILEKISKASPDLIAIDAPLTYEGINRECDSILSPYGALPVTLRGMEVLARRGTNLAAEVRKTGCKYLEVYSKATGKILGFHDPDESVMQRKLLAVGLRGDLERRILSRDEIDALFAALTAYLHAIGATEEVGDEKGKIVIPKV
jgi:predicted nuclease with RNAse H fold